jgi:hypothetical protein
MPLGTHSTSGYDGRSDANETNYDHTDRLWDGQPESEQRRTTGPSCDVDANRQPIPNKGPWTPGPSAGRKRHVVPVELEYGEPQSSVTILNHLPRRCFAIHRPLPRFEGLRIGARVS